MALHRSSIGKDLWDFFEKNPDEHLLTEDIAARYGISATEVRNRLRYLRDQGVLTCEEHWVMRTYTRRNKTLAWTRGESKPKGNGK